MPIFRTSVHAGSIVAVWYLSIHLVVVLLVFSPPPAFSEEDCKILEWSAYEKSFIVTLPGTIVYPLLVTQCAHVTIENQNSNIFVKNIYLVALYDNGTREMGMLQLDANESSIKRIAWGERYSGTFCFTGNQKIVGVECGFIR